ncbi:MAG: hypothetical protein AAFU79_10580 [Myxococcota bacterium]
MTDLEGTLQSALAQLYRLDDTLPLSPFRVGDEFYAALGITEPGQREALLVHSDGEHTDVALFLSDAVREGARSCLDALARGAVEDLDAFCAVVEGVSHFVYFTWAGDARPVSRLELELQAEIDKFLVLREVLGLRGDGLIEALFERFSLSEDLEAEGRERYVVANRNARRYARWADTRFARGRGDQALDDARRLYRMPMSAKLAHIARAA